MPLIALLLLFLGAVFMFDRRIFFRVLYVLFNLWLPVLFLAATGALTARQPWAPWFDPTGTTDIVFVYLMLLSAVSALLQFFLCRLLALSSTAAFIPAAAAVILGAALLYPSLQTAMAILLSAALVLQILFLAAGLKKIFR